MQIRITARLFCGIAIGAVEDRTGEAEVGCRGEQHARSEGIEDGSCTPFPLPFEGRKDGGHRIVRTHGHRLFFRGAPLGASIRSVSTGRPTGGTEAGGAPAGAQDHQGFVI